MSENIANAQTQNKQKAERKGHFAEVFAEIYFTLKCYKILARRYKTKVGEIDLIISKNNTIIAVEVKARKEIKQSLQAISPHQQRRISKALKWWIARHDNYHNFTYRVDGFFYKSPFCFKHLKNIIDAVE